MKSFGELKSIIGKSEPKPELDPTKELFKKVLAGKFDKVAKGNFESHDLPPITSITFLPFYNEATGKKIIYATIFYSVGDKESQTTWSIFENGIISGKIPPDLAPENKRKQIELEILSLIEKVNLDFWHQTDVPIGLEEDEGQERELPPPGEGPKKDLERPERLEFYRGQPGVLFGAIDKKNGFDGYKLIVFQGENNDFFILDKEFLKNAAFIIDLSPEERLKLENVASKEERDALLKRHWAGLRQRAKTRKEMVAILGAKKIVHNKTWEQRMQQEIKKRT